ncbi:sushi domain-containing protein 1 isoform X2 [Coregonus clupeaformis]|uniref:sushi domain-containing protein 1 isoform X2 n=1 Tax=Coregonus clupeaformis TaxID=59861 RepID=UPI001BE0F478|nr:sushi domain-containing protein 1 isoform X2 [Coregonus clupeaformis]
MWIKRMRFAISKRGRGTYFERMYWRTALVILAFLIHAITEMRVTGQTLDVCATCHPNATCEKKVDGAGKACNCMYGFVGNGRTYCQDKDECQIGANKICGQHTACHNTYGSYYCTCLAGYSPSNNMAIFIPNDGTRCQDIDECRVQGICGEGGQCRNMQGDFNCLCQVGYQVHNGAEPFHPHQDKALCKAIDCGQPPSALNAVQLSATGTRYGSVAKFGCSEGFFWKSGENSSVCGAESVWKGPSLICEEITCGDPPILPHTGQVWNGSTIPGSTVLFYCKEGFHREGGGNISQCTRDGYWTKATFSCKEVDCGSPPVLPHSVMLWDQTTRIGSVVVYQCNSGYYNVGKGNVSVCTANGQWDQTFFICEEIMCGDPPILPHTGQVWNGSTIPGSTVLFYCKEGFHREEGGNISQCTRDGYWTKATLSCKEVDCGSPPVLPHSVMLWDQTTRIGSVVVYQCNSGYYNVGNGNVSVCTANGQWDQTFFICEEIMCGDPPTLPHTGQVWNGSTIPGSTVLFYCKEGFHREGGGNISQCTRDGYWTKATLSCKEVDCGSPPVLPHSVMLWDQTTRIGSEVVYQCNSGYYNVGKGNVSVCTANGQWDQTFFICEEIMCGDPPTLPHTGQVWNGSTIPGSTVLFYCKEGFHREEGGNISQCTRDGYWTKATLSCKEVDCGSPPVLPHSVMLWDQTTRIGSEVVYQCNSGYYNAGKGNVSVCTANGQWDQTFFICEEIMCGDPPILPHTGQVWNGSTIPGSTVLFYCKEGFHREGGGNISQCTRDGYWTKATLSCKAKCGPVPSLANTEVVWQNTSVVFHRCLKGFHSWRGRNTSICDITGKWQAATMRCREIKPAISDLVVFNEKCLRWQADKYEEDTENYRVAFVGFRAYQRSFHDKRKKLLSSTSDRPEICLNLLPVTNYTISITALSARFTSTLTTNTSLQVPQAPEILYREVEAPLPTLWLRRSANTLDSISFYQVFVLPLEGTLVFDCSSPKNPDFSSQRKHHGQYITAQLHLRDIGKEMNLTVGDGRYYGGFYNAPLQNGRDYYIILRAVSQWGGAFKHSCVIWAKVRDISYVMKVSSLFAGGSIGVFALAIFLGYCYTWFCKKA